MLLWRERGGIRFQVEFLQTGCWWLWRRSWFLIIFCEDRTMAREHETRRRLGPKKLKQKKDKGQCISCSAERKRKKKASPVCLGLPTLHTLKTRAVKWSFVLASLGSALGLHALKKSASTRSIHRPVKKRNENGVLSHSVCGQRCNFSVSRVADKDSQRRPKTRSQRS